MKNNVIPLRTGRVPQQAPKPLTIDDVRLERQYHRLARKLRRAKGNSHLADIHTLKAFLTLTMELIPLARATYKQSRSDSSIYALNGLVNQARELMNDIRMLRTGRRQHEHIVNKIMLPNMQLLLQHYMDDCNDMKLLMEKLSRVDRQRMTVLLTERMRGHAAYFKQISEKIQHSLAEYMIG